jgi:hypothetical protein
LSTQRLGAFGDFARCAKAWGILATQRKLGSPKKWVGVGLRFEDGTSPFVFRETALREVRTDDPAVLVIQFRLAFLGSNRHLHAAFRRECVLHTPLFAGFPGFRSKLWADDVNTGVFAGVYEWQSARLATEYAERMVALLAPFSNPGTARYHVIERLRRNDYLAVRGATRDRSASSWWQLVEAPTGGS